MASQTTQTLTIASGQTVSDACQVGDYAAFGMVLPAAITGSAITYQVSADGTTFQALYDSTGASAVSTAVAASRAYDLPDALTAWRAFKLVSGSSEGADRSVVITKKRA